MVFDMQLSGAKMTRVGHARNIVQFGELETSIPAPEITVIADELSSSSYGISAGLSNIGWNAFASVEEDGTRMGLGYSHAWDNAGVFGDEVRLLAGYGDDVLDVAPQTLCRAYLFNILIKK